MELSSISRQSLDELEWNCIRIWRNKRDWLFVWLIDAASLWFKFPERVSTVSVALDNEQRLAIITYNNN